MQRYQNMQLYILFKICIGMQNKIFSMKLVWFEWNAHILNPRQDVSEYANAYIISVFSDVIGVVADPGLKSGDQAF